MQQSEDPRWRRFSESPLAIQCRESCCPRAVGAHETGRQMSVGPSWIGGRRRLSRSIVTSGYARMRPPGSCERAVVLHGPVTGAGHDPGLVPDKGRSDRDQFIDQEPKICSRHRQSVRLTCVGLVTFAAEFALPALKLHDEPPQFF